MTDIPRRTISDLVARYELEPSLRDIFVEGRFDQEVITRAIHSIPNLSHAVYEIDSVDISDSDLKRHKLTSGNKQRVITLARELALHNLKCEFRLLVDRDLDHWFGQLESTSRLRWTDYSSLELYFYCDAVLRDILEAAARCRIPAWDPFAHSMTEALRTLYILRVADRDLGYKLSWLSPDRCLTLNGGVIFFDQSEYIKRVLLHNSRIANISEFLKSVEKWRQSMHCDHRLCIHGHDFTEVLAWAIKEFKGIKAFASTEAISRILILMAHKAAAVIKILN